MFTDPYSGKFSLFQGVQQIAPLLLQFLLMQKAFPGGGGDKGALGQAAGVGMASPETMGGLPSGPQTGPIGGGPQMGPPSPMGGMNPMGGQGMPPGMSPEIIQQLMQLLQMFQGR